MEKRLPMSEIAVDEQAERVIWQDTILFIVLHLLTLYAFLFQFEWRWLALAVASYYLRMFALSAGFHRYFSHHSYQTSRVFRFLLAFLGECSLQKGVLWWASHHRHHHRHSDQPEDVHSPLHKGFFWSHMGWILCRKYKDVNAEFIQDFMTSPELVWFNDNTWLPANLYILTLYLLFGPLGVLWGFVVGTVLLWHGTFTINSLVHVWGTRPYATGDNSRNNLIGAILTLGDGWHNNHHHYPVSVRHGFRWWQIDPTYYLLCGLERLGLVWDLKRPARDRIDALACHKGQAV
ncbi:MAG: acyl-CoA desaturase [Gammaproteobacteria bacterium]